MSRIVSREERIDRWMRAIGLSAVLCVGGWSWLAHATAAQALMYLGLVNVAALCISPVWPTRLQSSAEGEP